jgi:Iodothyronine deiodinase
MTTATKVRGSARYRFDHPAIPDVMADLRIPASDLGPGDRIPDFDLPATDGGRITSADLASGRRPTLLVFGSLTCPVTESGGGGLAQLHARYGDQIRFVMVYVREAHPGALTRQPRTFEAKLRNAGALRVHHGFGFEVAVDDIDGTVHRAFGPRPNSAYLIDPAGRIVFRAHWADVTSALEAALADVAAGNRPRSAKAGRTLRSMAIMTGFADVAFGAAGPGALADTWKVAPPFGMMIVTSRLFGFLPRGRRGTPAMIAMAVMMIVVVAAIVVALP